MYTRLNKNARKNFVGHKTTNGVGMYFSTPFNKSSATHLTIKTEDGQRIDLKGHSVNALMNVLNTGVKLRKQSRKASTKCKRAARKSN
jgi:hypothetical protein